MEVFTPILNGKREKYLQKDVEVLHGTIDKRGLGLHAVVRINGKVYVVLGKACDFEHCYCDAEIKPIE